MSASSSRLARWLALLALIVMLVTGLCTFQDYGFTVDEDAERTTSIVNYQYILETLFHHELRIINRDLHTYGNRYYGVALQMPTVIVEHLSDFRLQNYHIFLMRHLYTFLLCMAGYVCFYFFLRNVFENDWLALLGALMLALYPRFWGEQFTNIKDMPFMATVCAGMLCVSLCLKHEGKWRYEVLAAFAFALSANTRILGFLLPLLLLGYRVLRDLLVTRTARQHGTTALWKNAGCYLVQPLLTLVFFVVITPPAWQNPLQHLYNTFITFSNYSTWNGVIPFLGELCPGNQLPWYYVPLWLGISLPLWYIVLLIASAPVVVTRLARQARSSGWACLLTDTRYYLLALVIACVPVLAMGLTETTVYNAWRHFYFIMPALVLMILFSLRALWSVLKSKRTFQWTLTAALCVLLSWQCAWIVREHPMERVYFNPVGRTIAEQMERDYWAESIYHQFQFILSHDNISEPLRISRRMRFGNFYDCYFSYEDQARIRLDDEYIIMTYEGIGTPTLEGYTLVHEMCVDQVPISGVFLRDDILQERFGGVYPD